MQYPPSPQMIFGFLYPKKCVGCQSLGKYFCDKCLKNVCVVEGFYCPWCSRESVTGRPHLKCKSKTELDGVVSFLPYKGLVGAGIRLFKYKLVKKIEDEFYKIFLVAVKQKLKKRRAVDLIDFLKLKPVVIPVPLYWRKHNFRGFNQAEVVSEMVARVFGLRVESGFLVRKKQTKPQAKLSKKERRENLKLAFDVCQKKSFRDVLLVDDVWTTGETMRSASKALKKAGVSRVWGLSLAR